MAIDGLIILDETCRPIVQTGFRSQTSAYALLHIDAITTALAKAERPGNVDPILYVSSTGMDPATACCHIQVGDMRLVSPVSGDVDPLYALSFLQTFVDILGDYFGTVSAPVIRENFDIVYQLLEETLDAGGHPLTTSTNALRDIVLPPTLLHKILTVAGVSGLANQASLTTPFSSPIPWRKAGVRHNNNEIYFDVSEELKAVVNKSSTALVSNVWGRIDSNSKLSGTPDLLLSFANAKVIDDCSFHPCVRLQRWARDKSLSFVPPDGRFTLMQYRYVPTTSSAAITSPAIVPVPFNLKPVVRLDDSGGTLDVTLASRLPGKPIDRVSVELYLGQGATAANLVASGDSSWGFDPKTLTLKWETSNLTSSGVTLRGTFSSSAKYPRPARAFRVKFEILQHSFSALRVDQLRLTGETYKPYKGVRARSSGTVEWRW
ncbi:clathrin adaptor mu subunit [Punctularia strigosozonata HHB-11173 SS5]|uniref:clathrin adaptor mu subunit n=1 Tax=Punctularia strigosozonata (strain HHB-11173) TaxID=741275 RepID=UPI000441827C|nr:clathrin adaptor mu subunit [Punctularia strigosozonata HHB-11173 SS5]EIN10787.1 clathrin adaptor mu subunit [Punctularia strigosozonata HHB-11173 SS5]